MDLKFNNSRKYVSITVPSKTQAMSPHIKSIDDIVVLGINLSRFNKLTQFFICVAGVFVFYLIYGYLQELIFSMEGFKPYGWYLTLVQFAFYSIFGLIELQLIQDKRRRIPGKTYMIIAFLTVGTMGLSNTSLGYLNYPTQVIFKCCKLIPVMLGGVFIQGKRYNVADVSAALCMSLGLIWFTLADSTVAPNFNLTGVILISLALCADAVIGNVQEKAMKLHNASNSEMVLYSYSIGFVYILLGLTCTSGLGPAVTFCSKNPVRTYGYAFLFSLTGYFGISFVLALIKIFGALLAVTVTTGRKAMTIVLSFIFFAKPFTFQVFFSSPSIKKPPQGDPCPTSTGLQKPNPCPAKKLSGQIMKWASIRLWKHPLILTEGGCRKYPLGKNKASRLIPICGLQRPYVEPQKRYQ
uniref:Adenosine 3'-phospho 5'-phosphosulfate transporter 2 n=1 Tax=Sus scrofa TaxID=9823 RepID=A0A8D1RTQ5_PIG